MKHKCSHNIGRNIDCQRYFKKQDDVFSKKKKKQHHMSELSSSCIYPHGFAQDICVFSCLSISIHNSQDIESVYGSINELH